MKVNQSKSINKNMEKEELCNYPETADVETSSEDYATRFSGKLGAWFLHIQEKATLKMLAKWPGASILDVGGGHGQLTEPLIRNGYKVTVFGSAPVCQHRIQEWVNNKSCEFETGNILELPFQDKSFDVVISFRLVSHVQQWPKFLSQLSRVARKAVIIDYPSLRSLNYISPMLFNFKKKLEGNTRCYTSFYEDDLVKVFNTNYFIVAERYAQFFLPMVFHRTLKFPALSSFLESFCRWLGLSQLFGSPIIIKFIRKNGIEK